jgi:predicted N-acyltransferase
MICKSYTSIAEIPPELWVFIFHCTNPFSQHAFLLTLEKSGCVSAQTGWQPHHLLVFSDGEAIAAMPLYIKNHSYGEFVFDWGWAEAYSRHGLDYYPKLVSAIPFSPVTGPRIGMGPGVKAEDVFPVLVDSVRQLAITHNYSSWHLLFPNQDLQQALAGVNDETLLHREAVQFHWFNREFHSFDDFLATLRSSRRKTLKRERRKVAEQGVSLQRLIGTDISDEDWQGFYHCYVDTYRKRSGHDGYLSREFFDLLRQSMVDQLMLVVARSGTETVAASLFLFDDKTLYGRYWGALQDISCLHFEACFYQGIEFCIERNLEMFDPGTQGEHKLMRGFEPVRTTSYHWIADLRFREAISNFLKHEKLGTGEYQKQAESLLPYKLGTS